MITLTALALYLGSLCLLAIGAMFAAPLAANPENYIKWILITSLVQIISACYLFTKGFNNKGGE